MTKPVEICQIKVKLNDSQPLIWRRIQVRSDITLAKLHTILQRVIGWEDTHLHRFVIQGERYGVPDEKGVESHKTKDERKHILGEVVADASRQFVYEYDFGDNWQHVLLVEKTLPIKEAARYPVCVAGARACPPEDVGGMGRYDDFLQAIANPAHPEHDDFAEWIGGNFDSEAFDLDEVNRKLRYLKSD
ncbi:MAG: plasmid pRiA4b ORF-3 family protein [Candidatus Acidiferrales bacterium]